MMSDNTPKLSKVFYIAIFAIVIGLILAFIQAIWDNWLTRVISAIGSSLFAGGIITALFEYYTISDKLKIMTKAFNNMTIGVIIHRDHNEILPRNKAIETHLKRKGIARIMSSNKVYVDKDDTVSKALLEKCKEKCKVHILLNIPPPIYTGTCELTIGYCNNIRTLCANIDEYQQFIDDGNKQVEIKCLVGTVPLNFVAYGKEKIYHGLTMLTSLGRNNPCIEIQPSGGDDCIYEAYITEFDKLFNNKNNDHLLLNFEKLKQNVTSWKNDPVNAAKWYLSFIESHSE